MLCNFPVPSTMGPKYFRSVSGDIKFKNLTKNTSVIHCNGVWVKQWPPLLAFSPVFLSACEQRQNILKCVKQG